GSGRASGDGSCASAAAASSGTKMPKRIMTGPQPDAAILIDNSALPILLPSLLGRGGGGLNVSPSPSPSLRGRGERGDRVGEMRWPFYTNTLSRSSLMDARYARHGFLP